MLQDNKRDHVVFARSRTAPSSQNQSGSINGRGGGACGSGACGGGIDDDNDDQSCCSSSTLVASFAASP